MTVFTTPTLLAICLGSVCLGMCPNLPQSGGSQAYSSETNWTMIINIQAYWIVLNVSGDLLLIILSIVMLRKLLTTTKSQKLALADVFLIVGIDVLFDILRTIYKTDADLANFLDANQV